MIGNSCKINRGASMDLPRNKTCPRCFLIRKYLLTYHSLPQFFISIVSPHNFLFSTDLFWTMHYFVIWFIVVFVLFALIVLLILCELQFINQIFKHKLWKVMPDISYNLVGNRHKENCICTERKQHGFQMVVRKLNVRFILNSGKYQKKFSFSLAPIVNASVKSRKI